MAGGHIRGDGSGSWVMDRMSRRYPVIKQMRFTVEEDAWVKGEAGRLGVSENEVLRRLLAAARRVEVGG